MIINPYAYSDPTYSADLIPVMTSNSAPSGTASQSTYYLNTSYQAWRAMDDTLDAAPHWYSWITSAGVTTGWIQYQFTSAKTIVKVNSFRFSNYDTIKFKRAL